MFIAQIKKMCLSNNLSPKLPILQVMGPKDRLNALLRTAKILAAVAGLYMVFFVLTEAPILSAMHLQMESLHSTATQLDPQRYFDIPAGLPALPKNFIPVRWGIRILP